MKYYRGANLRMKEPELLADVERVSGRVLVVDDVADTGTSLEFVVRRLKGKGAREIRTATIAYKPRSRVKPDYFVYETDKWVVFPWEEAPRKPRL